MCLRMSNDYVFISRVEAASTHRATSLLTVLQTPAAVSNTLSGVSNTLSTVFNTQVTGYKLETGTHLPYP